MPDKMRKTEELSMFDSKLTRKAQFSRTDDPVPVQSDGRESFLFISIIEIY